MLRKVQHIRQSSMELNRDIIIKELEDKEKVWDILVIGGGASGLGAALEASTRGYCTLLLEQDDFAKGTSSRSTKLIHGGVRYLAQGNISLVMEALRERGILLRNVPHLVKIQSFIIPCYKWWCLPFYTIGLTIYDLLAGNLGIGRTKLLSRQMTIRSLPAVKRRRLRGGVRYYDCQFDDARLAINLCQTIFDQGGIALNHTPVTALYMVDGRVSGAVAMDRETGKEFTISARMIINATGVFVDRVIKMSDPDARDVVRPSQGIHLVLDHRFLKGEDALMIPRTSDGRVLFAVPWYNRVVVGTTDVEKDKAELEPQAGEQEIKYILDTAGRFFDRKPKRKDVLSLFTGLRPLAAPEHAGKKTKEISRGHKILVSGKGLVTITGGKWTTYRKMGEEVIDMAARISGLSQKKSVTRDLKIHGWKEEVHSNEPNSWYGTDLIHVKNLVLDDPSNGEIISEHFHVLKAQVIWAIRGEMARTVEDFLSRRTRVLQLDAREAIRMAPKVAAIMADELRRDSKWESAQVKAFTQLAHNHLPLTNNCNISAPRLHRIKRFKSI